jgi:uncharacterized protein (DUF2235 family)
VPDAPDAEAKSVGRKLIVCCDSIGTLPEPDALTKWLTKVYDVLGLAFGLGVLKNIRDAYRFLMEVWELGDRIFLFGFSRGAYTVRVLAGMLHAVKGQLIKLGASRYAT